MPKTNLKIVHRNEHKGLRDFRQGRINTRKEFVRQNVIRRNLERLAFKQIRAVFSKFVNTQAYLIKEFNLYDVDTATRDLDAELLPVMYMHYKKVYRTIFSMNENNYDKIKKSEEALVFGRNMDIEDLIDIYNRNRLLYLTNISVSMAKRIERIITEGREEGLSLTQLAEKISDKVLPIGRSRAALIARTETHNAASFANHQYHEILKKDLDINMMKKWVATSDLRTRSAHIDANGQIRQMDEPFEVGGTAMMHAGDPNGGAKNNVNCRCVIVYADSQDIVL